MSWDPMDDDQPRTRRLSRGMCECEMCNEPADEGELTTEDIE